MPEIVAYHEAGHVIVAVLLGARVRSVTIEPDNDDGPERFGDAQIEWDHDRFSHREILENQVLVALAGPVAEMIYRQEPLHPATVPEWKDDWQMAWKMAEPLVPDDQKRLVYLERETRRLHRLLNSDAHWPTLAVIVDHLLAHETLEGEMVDEILANWAGWNSP